MQRRRYDDLAAGGPDVEAGAQFADRVPDGVEVEPQRHPSATHATKGSTKDISTYIVEKGKPLATFAK